MRWSRLFDDLEAQLTALDEAELFAEVAEHTRSVRGELVLTDRLAAHLGAPVRLRVRGIGVLEGDLVELGEDWLVVRVAGGHGHRAALVPVLSVVGVWGLSGRADPHPGLHQRRLGIRQALRAISRDRQVVRLTDVDGTHTTGTIDRVGRDHLDLADHPEDVPRRAGQVRQAVVVPFWALACVTGSRGASVT